MQAARTFEIDELPADIESDLLHTLLTLLVCKLTPTLGAPFDQLLTDLGPLKTTRAQLERDVAAQDAAVPFADDDLNVLLDETKDATGALSDKPAAAALNKQLFGDLSPSQLRRFLLGDQLETQRLWPGPLGKSTSPVLQDIGARTVKAVGYADQVLEAQSTAQTVLDQFTLGPWAAFIAACNAARANLFGKLLELTKDPANGPLPPDFVDRFFIRDTSGRAPRLDELNRAVTRLTNQLTRITAQRDALAKKQKDSLLAKKKGELAKKKAKLASKQKGMTDEEAEIAALEAEIAKDEAP